MRCFTEENDARIADPTQQRLEVGGSNRLKRFRRCRNRLD